MKNFNTTFKTKLYDIIQELEDNSLVEIVVIVKPQSASYTDSALKLGVGAMILLYSFFMFSPFAFDVFLIYAFTILSFFLFFGLTKLIPQLHRLIINKKQIDRAVELKARAIFQKGGMRFTNDRIGVLFYFSVFEQRAFIIADRGAQTAVPQEEWDEINKQFSTIFETPNPADTLLNNLQNLKTVFHTYIPPIENDINELPDDLDVDI